MIHFDESGITTAVTHGFANVACIKEIPRNRENSVRKTNVVGECFSCLRNLSKTEQGKICDAFSPQNEDFFNMPSKDNLRLWAMSEFPALERGKPNAVTVFMNNGLALWFAEVVNGTTNYRLLL